MTISPATTAPATTSPAGKHVMIVDDNRDAADSLQMLFEVYGYRAACAYDGRSALEAARADPPDIIVMDLGMPGMDGYQTARAIRALPGGERIVLIALTGWGHEDAREKTSAAGFNHHIVKPVNFETLRGWLTGTALDS
jgi:CheY-like chemotaxis protein